jgi:hypothetical protein
MSKRYLENCWQFQSQAQQMSWSPKLVVTGWLISPMTAAGMTSEFLLALDASRQTRA